MVLVKGEGTICKLRPLSSLLLAFPVVLWGEQFVCVSKQTHQRCPVVPALRCNIPSMAAGLSALAPPLPPRRNLPTSGLFCYISPLGSHFHEVCDLLLSFSVHSFFPLIFLSKFKSFRFQGLMHINTHTKIFCFTLSKITYYSLIFLFTD